MSDEIQTDRGHRKGMPGELCCGWGHAAEAREQALRDDFETLISKVRTLTQPPYSRQHEIALDEIKRLVDAAALRIEDGEAK